MKHISKTFLGFSLLLLSFLPASASHIVGGEMSYVCLGNNLYRIQLKLFRDCSPGNASYDFPTTNITIFDSLGNVFRNLEIPLPPSGSPGAPTQIPNSTGNACLQSPPNVCVEEAIFTDTVTLPPKPGGYTIAYQRCCRNVTILNVPQNTGATYVADIPGSEFVTCNSSPTFNLFPPTVICVNSPLVFDHSATDPDGDSLSYFLFDPYSGASVAIPQPSQAASPPYDNVIYTAGTQNFSYTNPLGISSPLSIDPKTGLLTCTPRFIGQYVVAIGVKEYRNGILLGIHYRDFQFNVVDCTQTAVASIPPVINTCSDSTIHFQNKSSNNQNYFWDFGVPGSTNDTSHLQFPIFTYPDTGVYLVKLWVNRGKTCQDSATSLVYNYPTLVPGLITVSNVCPKKSIPFTDTSKSTFNDINSWLWKFGDSDSSHVQNPNHAYQRSGIYNVSLIVKTAKGCVDTAKGKVKILLGPTVLIPATIFNCSSETVNFPDNTVNGNVYQWDFGVQDSTSDTSRLKSPTYTYPDTGVYYAKLVVDRDSICPDSGISKVSVYPFLKAGDITSNGCLGVLLPFMDTSKTTYGSISYWKWTFNGMDTSRLQNPEYAFDTSGSLPVKLLVGNSIGCIDSITKKVTIYPLPQIASTKDSSICKKDSVKLDAAGGTSYTWSPNYNISGTTLQDPVVSPKKTTTYHVTITDFHGCIGNDSVKITVYDTLYAHAFSDTLICPGGTVKLSGSGLGAYHYWQTAGGVVSPDSLKTIAHPSATTTYTFTEAAGSCAAIATVLAVVKPFPVIIASPDQNVCTGDTTTLTASGGTSYVWHPTTGLSSSTGESVRAFTVDNAVYYVVGKDANACPASETDSVIITIRYPGTSTINRDTTIIAGTYAYLSSSGGTAYHWRPAYGLNNTSIANPLANPTVTTTYYVDVTTAPYGCIATDSVVIKVVIAPIINFPNAFTPNGDGHNDHYHPIIVGPLNNYEFRIYNRWGQMVYSSSNPTDEGWDGTFKGKLQDVGVYEYYFEGVSPETGSQYKDKGNISLLR